jgi:hypothetical protein
LCRQRADANLNRLMPMRIKSSFIYLANAANDLRSNWKTLVLVLAPAAILAALCLLPDALNLQQGLEQHFERGMHNVVHQAGWHLAQNSYPLSADPSPAPFSAGETKIAYAALWVMTLIVNLLVLCTIQLAPEPAATGVVNDAAAIFRSAVKLAPAYAWVALLHYAIPGIVAIYVTHVHMVVSSAVLWFILSLLESMLIIIGVLVYLWLYFAPFALVFDDKHSFHALLFSRDLIRKRFFRVAIRIAVFLAVWWGYDASAAVVFGVTSLVIGPVVVLAGSVSAVIYVLDLGVVIVHFATNAFFVAAGVRLYKDLRADFAVTQTTPATAGLGDTVPLEPIANPAAG